MPPVKHVTAKDLSGAAPTGKSVTTRVRNHLSTLKEDSGLAKRKAESPIKGKTTKRSAFGDITNALSATSNSLEGKRVLKKAVVRASTLTKPTAASLSKSTRKSTVHNVDIEKEVKDVAKPNFAKPTAASTSRITRSKVISVNEKDSSSLKAILPPPPPQPVQHELVRKPIGLPPVPVLPNTRTTKQACDQKTKLQPVTSTTVHEGPVTRRTSGRLSNESEKTDESSLYVSALESLLGRLDMSVHPTPAPADVLPEPEFNIDEETVNDPFQVSVYAHHIFCYLKSRECKFVIENYLDKQPYITKWMRSLLVDWMVEVQENFELNHETLYLAVKLVDLYMSRQQICKEVLQLLGAVSILIAAKYDERIPPSIDDFLYLCDGAYKRKDITKMEVDVLKVIDFDLGIPLSYRFLRRYARCAKVQMPLLTLARYILEYSLMDYSTVTLSDSKLAAAALLLAFKMTNHGDWSKTLHYFTGYKIEDFKDIVHQLNGILHKKPKDALSTVRNKYSHKIFFEVAKTPLINDLDL